MTIEYHKHKSLIEMYKLNIKKIDSSIGADLNLFCYTSNCKEIAINGIEFVRDLKTGKLIREDNFLIHKTYSTKLHELYSRYIYKPCFTVTLKNNNMLSVWLPGHDPLVILKEYYPMLIVFLMWYAFIFFKNAGTEASANIIAKKNIKTVLEGKLQYTVAGSMHHEMLGPITVIKDLFEEIRAAIILHYKNDDSTTEYKRRAADKAMSRETIIDYIEKISSSIDRLHGVLALLRESKDNRYSNGNKNIAMLTTNLFATTSIFTSRHFEYEIKNKELLETLHLKELPNGEFMNILSNLVTNSVEAKCSKVIMECELIEDDLLQIYCIDNGTGVIGKDGTVINEDEYELIFNYGVSSKDLNGEHVCNTDNRMMTKLKTMIGSNETFTNDNGRGLGMYVIKETLKKYKGSITLYKTSTDGTIFKLLIPVEPYTYMG